MNERKILITLIGLAFLLVFLFPAVLGLSQTNQMTAKVADRGPRTTFATFTVMAPASTALPDGTPIVLKATDFPLPYSMLNTAIVYDGSDVALTTQCDDLTGDGVADEIVFLLDGDLAAGASRPYTLAGFEQGLTNGFAANTALKVANEKRYNATYDDWLPTSLSASHMNGSTTSSLVDERAAGNTSSSKEPLQLTLSRLNTTRPVTEIGNGESLVTKLITVGTPVMHPIK
ncbi:MAG: DUF4861 family protein [Candidatus Hodarchaeales archaeon]|jgi:hypothetical protein